jgi:pyruvate carboxylase
MKADESYMVHLFKLKFSQVGKGEGKTPVAAYLDIEEIIKIAKGKLSK